MAESLQVLSETLRSLSGTADAQATALALNQMIRSLGLQAATAEETDRAIARAARRTLANRAADDPDTSSTNQTSDQSQATFVVDEKGGVNARARISVPFQNPMSHLQLTVTAPINQHNATFATRTGLGKNASFEAAFKHTFFHHDIKYPAGEGRGTALPQMSSTARETVRHSRLGELAATLYGLTDREDVLRAVPQTLATLRRFADTTGLGPLVATLVSADAPEYGRLLSSRSLVGSADRFWAAYVQMPRLLQMTWTAHVSAAYVNERTTLDYLTDNTYEKRSFDRTATGATAAAGVSRVGTWKYDKTAEDKEEPKPFTTPLFYAGVSYRNVGEVDVADPRNICTALTITATECFKLPVGEPVFDGSAQRVIAEVRIWAMNQSVGVHPSYTWVTVNNRTDEVAEMRFYFLHQVADIDSPDVKFGADLAGGVTFGVKRGVPDGKGRYITVFLTKKFGLPN